MPAISPLSIAPDLTQQAYQAILDAICNGLLQPGERLTQERLAEKLSVSRQPVLQALRLLKQEGFIADAEGRGVLVAPLTADHILHLYQVRSALDGLAAYEAARAGAKLPAQLLSAGRELVQQKDVAAMIRADLAFHHAIYAAAGNPVLIQTMQHHWNHIRRVMGAVLQTSDLRSTVWDEHEAIFEAISSGQPEQARHLAQQHCSAAGEHLSRRLLQQPQHASSAPSSATGKRNS